jgi:hypothetical protein
MVDVARRLCKDSQIHVAEIWSYHTVGDQVRFTLVHRSREEPAVAAQPRTPRPTAARRPGAARGGKKTARAQKAMKKPARAQKRR